jgi:hypothetical protein
MKCLSSYSSLSARLEYRISAKQKRNWEILLSKLQAEDWECPECDPGGWKTYLLKRGRWKANYRERWRLLVRRPKSVKDPTEPSSKYNPRQDRCSGIQRIKWSAILFQFGASGLFVPCMQTSSSVAINTFRAFSSLKVRLTMTFTAPWLRQEAPFLCQVRLNSFISLR